MIFIPTVVVCGCSLQQLFEAVKVCKNNLFNY